MKLINSIKKMPIKMIVSKRPGGKVSNCNYLIKKNGEVLIKPFINPKELYVQSHGSGTIGKTWKNHHSSFFNLIKPYLKKNIIEIGAGDNSVLHKIKSFNNIEKFWSVGKNISIKNKKIKSIDSFFDEKIINQFKVDKCQLAIHSHLFEHIHNPNTFLQNIYKCLNENGYHIFSIPNMQKMIQRGLANAVNFEHPYYYDEKLVNVLLKNNGFEIKKVKYFGKCHSIMFITKKIKKFANIKYKNFKSNFKLFSKLFNKWDGDVIKIKKSFQNKNTYLFGGHVFSQVVIAKGKINNTIPILDNDKNKHNKYLYGTYNKIRSPEIIKNVKSPYIYLRAGEYDKEIKAQLKKINKSVKFI